LSATLLAWIVLGKPDFSMTVNGALAGLVAITAPCAFVSVTSAAVIGVIAGLIVVPAVLFFDKLKIDDPVGALSVHLANGIWGTIAVGLFASADAPGGGANGLFNGGGFESLQAQLIGTVAVAGFTLAVTLTAWFVIKMTLGIRVSAEDESIGLDISEMGMEAYGGDPMGQ
jgi:Amt family ammonium transporter